MAAFDKIKNVISKTGPIEGAMLVGALTQAEGKAMALAKAVGQIALFRLVPITAMIATGMLAVHGVIKSIIKDSGALEAAWSRLARLKIYQGQLEPLPKSATAVRGKLAELIVFSNKFKFALGELVGATRALEVVGRGALNSTAALKTAADMARTTGRSIESTAEAYAAMNREIRGGAPVAEATNEMRSMGMVSDETVKVLQRMQSTGASTASMLAMLEAEIKRNTSSAETFADTMEGLEGKLESVRETMAASFGESFLEQERAATERTIAITEKLIPVMKTLGESLAAVTSVGEGFGQKLKLWALSINGLPSLVGFLAKSLIVLGAALTLGGLLTGARAIGSLVMSVIRLTQSTLAAIGPTGMLALSQKLLWQQSALAAQAAAAQAAGNTALAASLNVAAAAAGRGAIAANMFGGAVAMAGAKIKAFTAALITNPLTAIVVALTATVAALWQYKEGLDASREAAAEARKANAELTKSFEDQYNAITDADSAVKHLADVTLALAEAQAVLNKMNSDPNADPKLIDAAREKVDNLITQKKNAKGKVRDTAGTSTTAREQAIDVARREAAMDEQAKGFAISKATGSNKVAMLREESRKKEGLAREGALYRSESAKIKDLDAIAAADPTRQNKEAAAQARKESGSELVREEYRIQQMREQRKSPTQIAAAEQSLLLKKEKALGADPKDAVNLREQADAEERSIEFNQIGLEAAKKEAALRSEGLKRTEDEAKIKIEALQKAKELSAKLGDDASVIDYQNQIDAAQQAFDMAKKQADIEREADESRLRVLELQTKATRAAIAGDFAGADRANKQALNESDAQANKESLRRRLASGEGADAARSGVAQEQRARDADRDAQRELFRSTKGRELESQEARNSGDGDKVAKMALEDSFKSAVSEAMAAGLGAEEATAYGKRKVSADSSDKIKEAAGNNMVVSSLAKIGGGGNTASGVNVLLEETKRQTAILDMIAKNTAGGTDPAKVKK